VQSLATFSTLRKAVPGKALFFSAKDKAMLTCQFIRSNALEDVSDAKSNFLICLDFLSTFEK
jgi:hypothetical protein